MGMISKGSGSSGSTSIPLHGHGIPLYISIPPLYSRASVHEVNVNNYFVIRKINFCTKVF